MSNVYWPSTALLTLERGAASGLIIAIILGINPKPGAPNPIEFFFIFLFFGPIFATLTHYIWRAVGAIGGGVTSIANIGMLVCALAIAIGGPLIWILWKVAPNVVPVDHFRFMNFQPLILVTKAGPAE